MSMQMPMIVFLYLTEEKNYASLPSLRAESNFALLSSLPQIAKASLDVRATNISYTCHSVGPTRKSQVSTQNLFL